MSWPPDDELLAAWQTLVADPTTASAFCNLALPPLVAAIRAVERSPDPDDFETAAGDALLTLIKNPSSYDPSRGTLPKYLLMSARGDLRNLRAKAARRKGEEISLEAVELDPPDGNEEADDSPFDLAVLEPVLNELTETDRAVFELMRAGVRATERYAAVMGVTHLPVAGQRAEAKRAKDRVLARLKRAVEKPDAR